MGLENTQQLVTKSIGSTEQTVDCDKILSRCVDRFLSLFLQFELS